MIHEYKSHGLYAAPVDPGRCRASVPFGGRSVSFRQCLRKAKKDGWCAQHHPDAEKARQEKSLERHRQQRANSPLMRKARRITLLEEQVAALTSQRDELLGLLRVVYSEYYRDALKIAEGALGHGVSVVQVRKYLSPLGRRLLAAITQDRED